MITIKHPHSLEEQESLLRLRYQVYRECGYIPKIDDKLDRDKYDHSSVHFLALDNDRMVGTVRFIPMQRDGKFPTESYFRFSWPAFVTNRNRVAEISRLVVDTQYRGQLILPAFLLAMYYYATRHGIDYCLASLKEGLLEKLLQYGIPAQRLPGKLIYEDEYLAKYFKPPEVDSKKIQATAIIVDVHKTREALLPWRKHLNGGIRFHFNADDILSAEVG